MLMKVNLHEITLSYEFEQKMKETYAQPSIVRSFGFRGIT